MGGGGGGEKAAPSAAFPTVQPGFGNMNLERLRVMLCALPQAGGSGGGVCVCVGGVIPLICRH